MLIHYTTFKGLRCIPIVKRRRAKIVLSPKTAENLGFGDLEGEKFETQ